MDAVLLVDGHFEFFEVEVIDTEPEDANEEVMGELVGVGEAGGGDGL
jgi:hypothetical protein